MEDIELLRAANNGKSMDVAEAQKTNPIILSHSESAEMTEINPPN